MTADTGAQDRAPGDGDGGGDPEQVLGRMLCDSLDVALDVDHHVPPARTPSRTTSRPSGCSFCAPPTARSTTRPAWCRSGGCPACAPSGSTTPSSNAGPPRTSTPEHFDAVRVDAGGKPEWRRMRIADVTARLGDGLLNAH
jgi:hypothetical protein